MISYFQIAKGFKHYKLCYDLWCKAAPTATMIVLKGRAFYALCMPAWVPTHAIDSRGIIAIAWSPFTYDGIGNPIH